MDKRLRSVEDLGRHLGRVVRYSTDGGNTWSYSRIRTNNQNPIPIGDSEGFQTNCEVMEDGVHNGLGMTHLSLKRDLLDWLFRRGLIVVLASDEEVKGKRFSYE
jgi:hypothetical protein